jgi:uncharacterized protein (TIGR02145 family)
MPPKHLTFAILLLAFTAHSGDSTITYANKTYKTVTIGTQTWLAENLNYETEGSVCYDNKPDNCAKYGRLYDWQTAMKVCPKGWHLPDNDEWDKLLRFVDGDKSTEKPYLSYTAGKHLKASSGWNGDGNGTDKYGFSALPGGFDFSNSWFRYVGEYGNWWSSSEGFTEEYDGFDGDYDHVFVRQMVHKIDDVSWMDFKKDYRLSVRCLQD